MDRNNGKGMTWVEIFLAALWMASCSPKVVEFSSPSPLAEGLRGKSWGEISYLEPNSSSPAVNSSSATTAGFDFAGSGDHAYLAASFYDATSLKFIGYGRTYSDSVGWGSAGTDFTVTNTISNDSVGHVSVAVSPGGGSGVLSTFLGQTTAAATTSVRYKYWLSQQTMTPASSAYPSFPAGSSNAFGPAVSTSFDSLGKAYTFYQADGLASGQVTMQVWEPAAGMAASSQQQVMSAYIAGPTHYRKVKSTFDGKQRVCVFAEDATYVVGGRGLYVRCLDTGGSTLATPSFAPDLASNPTPLSDGVTAGFDAASDGAGYVLAVFYQQVAGKWHLFSSVSRDGVWDTQPSQVSAAMESGFETVPVAATDDQISPGVAYLGSDRFVAVWAAVDTTNKRARLYYALHSKATGWSAAQTFGGDSTYVTTQPYGALHVFSNTQDNAGVAVNYLADETTSTRKVALSRYHVTEGWQKVVLRGYGCVSGANPAYCTHRPAGVILKSGVAVVVFQDKDASGRYRLAGVEYK